MYYYRARYYDSQIGRFISEDPIGFVGGSDFYAYVFDSPTTYSDPEGLKKKKAPALGHPYNVDPNNNVILSPLMKNSHAHLPGLIGDGWCVTFTRKIFPSLPCTRCWRRGDRVVDHDIPPGTAIATFENDRFPTDGDQNSGIYVGSQTYQDSNGGYVTGITIIDQFPHPYHPAGQHQLQYEGHGPNGGHERANSARDYYVILVPTGTTPGGCDCAEE